MNQKKMSMDFDRILEIVGKLQGEIEKRDKILDLLVSGGDVTLVHLDLDVDVDLQKPKENDNGKEKMEAVKRGTKTFQLLIKTIPYKIETVTLNHMYCELKWDELYNSLEKENSQIPLFSQYQDIKPNPKPQPKGSDANLDPNMFSLPVKRRILESDERTTTVCENKVEPAENQEKLEEKEKEYDFLSGCELPEFSMDKSFFENENPSATTSTSTSNGKFLIRLHDNDLDKICVYDRCSKSSSVLSRKCQLSLQELGAAINVHNSSNPGSKAQIWCEVKNFDIFLQLNSSSPASAQSPHFFKSFSPFISHFSFRQHSYTNEKQKSPSCSSSSSSLINSNFLIGFILQNFPHLEFLSINSEILTNLEDLVLNSKLNLPPSPTPLKLERLVLLKILPCSNNAARFTSLFFAKLLKRTPRLESLYGISLHCLKKTAELDKIWMKDWQLNSIDSAVPKLAIRSVFTLRDIYYNHPHKFLEDLLNLCNLDNGTKTGNGTGTGRIIVALEEFNAQRFFIQDPAIRENVGPLMTRILRINKESLIKLTLEPSPNAQTAIQIPRLKNLQILRFEFGRANFSSFFPRGFNVKPVSRIFPKLEQVEMLMAKRSFHALHFHHFQPESRISPDCLRCGETFETVKSLLLAGISPQTETETETGSGFFANIRSSFPNLTKLTLDNNLDEISLCLPQIFQHFPRLHQLVLEIDTDSPHGNLDAALTGINVDLCRKLEKFVPCPIEGNGKEKLLQIIQNRRSLSDLKELRLLKLVISSGGVSRKLNKIPILTPVFFEYGLVGQEQLKKVKIFLDFHERTNPEAKSDVLTALAPVLPFVTVL